MGVNKRCYSFEYSGNSKGVSQSVYFQNLQASCVSTTCDYTPLEYFVAGLAAALIFGSLTVITGGVGTVSLIIAGAEVVSGIVIALGEYQSNPDHPVILNNVNNDQKLTCCQNAFDTAPKQQIRWTGKRTRIGFSFFTYISRQCCINQHKVFSIGEMIHSRRIIISC